MKPIVMVVTWMFLWTSITNSYVVYIHLFWKSSLLILLRSSRILTTISLVVNKFTPKWTPSLCSFNACFASTNMFIWISAWFTNNKSMVRLWLTNIDNSYRCPYLFETKPLKLSLIKNYDSSDKNAGPFRRFPTYVWQNAHVNIVRHAMVCDVYFPFPKIL